MLDLPVSTIPLLTVLLIDHIFGIIRIIICNYKSMFFFMYYFQYINYVFVLFHVMLTGPYERK